RSETIKAGDLTSIFPLSQHWDGNFPLIVPKPLSEHNVQKYSVARCNLLWNQLIIGWDLGTHYSLRLVCADGVSLTAGPSNLQRFSCPFLQKASCYLINQFTEKEDQVLRLTLVFSQEGKRPVPNPTKSGD